MKKHWHQIIVAILLIGIGIGFWMFWLSGDQPSGNLPTRVMPREWAWNIKALRDELNHAGQALDAGDQTEVAAAIARMRKQCTTIERNVQTDNAAWVAWTAKFNY